MMHNQKNQQDYFAFLKKGAGKSNLRIYPALEGRAPLVGPSQSAVIFQALDRQPVLKWKSPLLPFALPLFPPSSPLQKQHPLPKQLTQEALPLQLLRLDFW